MKTKGTKVIPRNQRQCLRRTTQVHKKHTQGLNIQEKTLQGKWFLVYKQMFATTSNDAPNKMTVIVQNRIASKSLRNYSRNDD